MFWTYKQIPVNGALTFTDTIPNYIIIEDNWAEQANVRIDNFGIWFDEGSDISRDGRWPRAVGEGTEEPMINGVLAHEFIDPETPQGKYFCIILYRIGVFQCFPKV